MAKIEIGQRLKTNYGTGPYKVTFVQRNCTCVHVLDKIESIDRPMPPHLHLFLEDEEGKGSALNWYDEDTLCSVWPYSRDKLILLENLEPIQRSLAI